MNRSDLVRALNQKGYYKVQAEMVVNDVFEIITDSLSSGEQVMIKNFGIFSVHYRSGRRMHNVNTGQSINIPGHGFVTFRPAEALKESVKPVTQKKIDTAKMKAETNEIEPPKELAWEKKSKKKPLGG